MSGQDYGIGLKINLDTGAIKRLPQEMQQALGRLAEVFKDIGGAGEKRYGAALAPLMNGKGPSSKDTQEQRRNLAAARNALKDHYDQQERDLRKHVSEMEKLRRKEFEADPKKYKFDYKNVEQALRDDQQWLRRQKQNLRDEQRRVMSDMRNIGTDLPGAAGGGGRPGGGGLFGGGRGGGAVGGLLRGLGIPLTAVGLGYFAMNQLRQTLSNDTERFNLAKRIGNVGEIYGPSSKFADSLNIPLMGPEASIAAQSRFASIAGAGRRGQAANAALLGMGFGVGSEAGVDFFGGMSRMGATRGDSDQRKFAMLLGEAIVNANMRGREGEMFSALTDFVQMGMRTMVSATPEMARDATTLMMRAAATGEPGMQGQLGMRVLGAAHNALSSTDLFPGVGGVMQPFMMMAMQNGGVSDPYEMQKIASQGMFGKVGGKFLYEGVLDQMGGSGLLSSGFGRLMASKSFQMSPDMFDKFLSMRNSGTFNQIPEDLREKIMGSPQRIGAAMAALQESGGNPQALRAALERVITETPGTEERERMVADASQALEAAFRRLIPIVDSVAAIFNKFIGGDNAVKIGGAATAAAGLTWAAKRFGGATAGAGASGASSALSSVAGVAAGAVRWAGPVGAALTMGGDTSEDMVAFRRHKAYQQMLSKGFSPDVESAIQAAAEKHGVDPALIRAVVMRESEGNVSAKSKGGDLGLMQINPSAHPGFDTGQAFNASYNVNYGTAHLSRLLKRYDGNVGKALAAYNAGEGRVASGQIPDSTKQYVTDVAGMASGTRVSFDPVVIIVKNEKGEVLQTSSMTPSAAPTGSAVAE